MAGLVSAVVVLAPLLLSGGLVLSYDMVFVPDPPLDEALLGLGSAVARAVPSDLVVALASQLLPAALVQRLVLAAVLVLGAWGAGRLVPRGGALAGAVAGTGYVWTAATYERLVLGQWALLLSLAVLPWVVAAAARLRSDGVRRAGPALVLWLAAAAVGSPAGGLLCATVAVVVVATGRRLRAIAFAAGAGVLVLLPWALPSLLRPGGVVADPAGLAAFAPRADTPLGTLGSLLTLGGVWNAQVVPPGRESWVLVPVALLLVGAGAAGAWSLRRERWWPGLIGCGALGLLVAMLFAIPGGPTLAAEMPGGGLLRDGQKYAAPYALLVAVGLGAAAARLPARLGALLLVVPVALVPALAWGGWGRLDPVRLPPDAAEVRELVAADPGPAVSLPWTAYRRPAWNDRRTVLDPVPRLLGVPVVVDDDLVLADRTVEGEDPLARRLDPVLSQALSEIPSTPVLGISEGGVAEALAEAGIRWAVLARGEPGSEDAEAQLRGARRVHNGPSYSLYRLPAVADPRPLPAGPPVLPVVVGDAAVLLAVVGAALVAWRRRSPRRLLPSRRTRRTRRGST